MAHSHIIISSLRQPTETQTQVDMVEYKGIGHPDTICDLLAESLSAALCRLYLDEFGHIMHHNVDKALLCAGKSLPRFGGGDIIEPVEIYFAGRAIKKKDGKELGIDSLAIELTRNWFRKYIPLLNVEKMLKVTPKIREGSAELVELFDRSHKVPLANDTSMGVGYAPFSRIDRLVIDIKNYLNSEALRESHPYIGRDIKVMGVQQGNRIDLTVAIAFIDRFIDSLDDYRDKKDVLTELLSVRASESVGQKVHVVLNAADNLEKGSIYLTVSGTSAEAGDDGQVGRGNRINQLITPYRPMSLEAIAGKNPISHVGKLYNIFANQLARTLQEEIRELKAVRCYLVSTIGMPIIQPQVVHLEVECIGGLNQVLNREIEIIVQRELEILPELWTQLISAKIDWMM